MATKATDASGDDYLTSWRELIEDEMQRHGESFYDCKGAAVSALIISTDRGGFFDERFDDALGSIEGGAFTVWTSSRVYFPACYDGQEWCASVPRDPCETPTTHIGGPR